MLGGHNLVCVVECLHLYMHTRPDFNFCEIKVSIGHSLSPTTNDIINLTVQCVMMYKICKSRVKVWEPGFLGHIINSHLLEAWEVIEMECDVSICKYVEWTQSLIVIVKT